MTDAHSDNVHSRRWYENWRTAKFKMEKKDAEIEQLERQREELSKLIANIPSEKEMKLDIMDLTHKYNEVKDATQTVIGAVAHIKGVTFKSLHEEFEVPFN